MMLSMVIGDQQGKGAEKVDNVSFRSCVAKCPLAKAGELQAWGRGMWTAEAKCQCGIICIQACCQRE